MQHSMQSEKQKLNADTRLQAELTRTPCFKIYIKKAIILPNASFKVPESVSNATSGYKN